MYNYKLMISYDGTHYSGWQVQPNGISIQGKIQEALQKILKHEVLVIGSGRTDAGVHALGQVAHFKVAEPLDLYRLLASLNGILPRDIRIKRIEPAALEFHAQHSAIGKTYHYHLHLDYVQDPFQRLYSWHVRAKVDLNLLHEASAFFPGTHDFTSFANEAHLGCAAYDPVRKLKRLDIVPEDGGVCLQFEGEGFLYKMVRNIVGTMIEVASGKRKAACIPEIFAAKDRGQAGQSAPPQGLFLMRVDYP